MKIFGAYIRELREAKKLPQRKVAAYLDIDTSILSKVERGERPLSEHQIRKLAVFFDLDLKKLQEEYLSEQVANVVYNCDNVSRVLKAAEQKAVYMRSNKNQRINS